MHAAGGNALFFKRYIKPKEPKRTNQTNLIVILHFIFSFYTTRCHFTKTHSIIYYIHVLIA